MKKLLLFISTALLALIAGCTTNAGTEEIENNFGEVLYNGKNIAGVWAVVEDDKDSDIIDYTVEQLLILDGEVIDFYSSLDEYSYEFKDSYLIDCTLDDFELTLSVLFYIRSNRIYVGGVYYGNLEQKDDDTLFLTTVDELIVLKKVKDFKKYDFPSSGKKDSVGLPIPLGNEIYYRTTDSAILSLRTNQTILAHTYNRKENYGRIVFNDPIDNVGSLYSSGQSRLTNINIPDGVTSIGDFAFEDCSSLMSITIPNGVTSIGEGAFYGCSSLENVTIPESVTSIGENAFYDCTGELIISSKIVQTDYPRVSNPSSNGWLAGAKFMKISVGDGVTSIGSGAFCCCSSLENVTIPESVTSIGSSAFYGCSSLASITIPESVTSIGDFAFEYCSSLMSITIPNGVTSIGEGAFYGCSSLENVTIPESVTSIGENAFYDCTGELIISSKIVQTDYPRVSNPSSNGWLAGAKFMKISVGDGVTSIGSGAFCCCSSLENVTIPESVTSIGSSAFYGCSSLASITIPESVTSIGDFAFEYCSSLMSITIPNGVTSIGKGAFNGCSSLESVTLPDSVTSIGGNAFYECSSLVSINIPDSVTSIERAAFYECSSLVSINIPDSVTSIERAAFYGCTSLENVTIPENVTSIGTRAFENCSSLMSITIPNGVTSIGDGAFNGCSSLAIVYCKPTTPPVGGSSMFKGNASGRKIFVPTESVEAYKTASYWSSFKSDIVGCDF